MNTKSGKSNESTDPGAELNKSRRSFAKGGLIAPVMMTLANRSAWGANACIGSGFQSYAAAAKNGQALSHAALDKSSAGTGNWQTPQAWYDSYASWNTGSFFPVRAGTSLGGSARIYEVYSVASGATSPSWHGKTSTKKYNLSDVNGLASSANWRIYQLFGGSDTVTTIYDALSKYSGTDGQKLLAYQVATKMNDMLYPLPYPPQLISLDDYMRFYSNCV